MDVDEQQSSASSSSKKIPKTLPTVTAAVPTQGRQIVVKRRIRSSGVVDQATSSSRSSLKIRKIEP